MGILDMQIFEFLVAVFTSLYSPQQRTKTPFHGFGHNVGTIFHAHITFV
jgi:hypothetical protein